METAGADSARVRRLRLVFGLVRPPSVDEIAAKSIHELEIDGGENVMLGTTGRKLGHIRVVLIDDGELIGIVMDPTGFFNRDVLVPVRFLGRSDDLALFVDATDEDIKNLKPIQP